MKELRNNLYKNFSTDFSQSRQRPWKGWKKIIKYLNSSKKLSILDLGCGNARFLKYLIANNIKISKYTGIDNSEEMLKEAEKTVKELNIKNYKLENIDLTNNNFQSQLNDHNLVVAFGVIHHLMKFEQRVNFIKSLEHLVSYKGVVVITFWRFANNKEFLKKHLVKYINSTDKFGKYNYELSFNKDASRLCHHFEDEEVEVLIAKSNMKVVEDFESDGFGDKMNRYVIFKKS